MAAIARRHELDGDSNTLARAPNAALEDRRHVQPHSDLTHVEAETIDGEGRGARDHPQAGDSRENVDTSQ
ncbi:MAG TPA: hypothetical protein VLB51_02685 [Methylomirabilota bacterium]|nr:hypothetical protein [Methylomirabilota bacterium]